MNHFSRDYDNFGFTISTKKTEVNSAWKTQEESVGTTRNQPRHQAKGLHGRGANRLTLDACETWTVYSRHARKRSVGGQKKRFKDTLRKTLTRFNIDVTNWEACAQDRPLWRSIIHTGARTAEKGRIAEAQKKRAARKARLYSISTSAGPTYPCRECGRVLQARIGQISHLRTHMANQL